jgi:outer membrane protein OmpA-like peptidoglycan-associated protein/tetratricopeptide (TPR) repeat protein
MKYLFSIVILLTFTTCQAQRGGPSNTAKIDALMNDAFRFYDVKEFSKALDKLDKVLSIEPMEKEALDLSGVIYSIMGDYKKAIEVYNKLIKYHPSYLQAYIYLAQAQYDDGDHNGMKKTLDNLLANPTVNQDVKKQAIDLRSRLDFILDARKNAHDIQFENMGSSINTKNDEYFPGFTIDESIMIFTRKINMNEDFYMSQKHNGVWSKAIPLPGRVNTPMNEGTISVTANGKYIFYTACNRPYGLGSCDIYLSILNPDGTFGEARNLKYPLNTQHWESMPSVSADGKTIYFCSNRPGGKGKSDIFKATWTGTGFADIENLGDKINTEGDEQSPFIHPDGKTLYFISDGRADCFGKSDIYVTYLTDTGWTIPKNLGYPINTENEELGMIVDRKGEFAYIASAREDSRGGLDIYKFNLPEEFKPSPVSYVKGVIYDDSTKVKLGASVELIDLATGEVVSTLTSDEKTGEFITVLVTNKRYAFNIDKEGYLFFSDNFDLTTTNTDALKPFIIEAGLKKPSEGATLVLKNIFFDVNKYALKPESKAELEKLHAFMKRFPEMKIEVGGHTDNTGNPASNQSLSENRAKAVVEFMVSLGVGKSRISYKGYADTEPIASNDTEEGKAENRRTEIKIISMN